VTPLILEGQWWRLFTAMFLHGGVIHLGSNMMGLWREGGRLEQEYVRWRQLALTGRFTGLRAQVYGSAGCRFTGWCTAYMQSG
jgi:membrane associated rhomboid family serine protease